MRSPLTTKIIMGEMNRPILRRFSRPLHWFEKRIPLGLRAATCATSDRYLATSDDLPSDTVVHHVRSRGRKVPAKRQVKSSAARKTHCASTGLAIDIGWRVLGHKADLKRCPLLAPLL